MAVQEIAVQIIIWTSIVYTLYNFIKLLGFSKKQNNHQSCTGCTSCNAKKELLVHISNLK